MGPMRTASLIVTLLSIVLLVTGCAGSGLPDPGPMPAGASFAGTWDSNWGQMKVHESGGKLHGTFTGFRNGSVSGEQKGDLFLFRWTQLGSAQWGRGFLRMSPDGQKLEGKWGYLKVYDNGGRWWASRAP